MRARVRARALRRAGRQGVDGAVSKVVAAETWWNAAETYASPLTACHQIEFIVEC